MWVRQAAEQDAQDSEPTTLQRIEEQKRKKQNYETSASFQGRERERAQQCGEKLRKVKYERRCILRETCNYIRQKRRIDPRTPCNAGIFSQPEKVCILSVSGDQLIIGMADHRVLRWVLQSYVNMGYVQQHWESSLVPDCALHLSVFKQAGLCIKLF